MGRAPSSDKNCLKKGPWTPEEDARLVDYIQSHGYGNWRTLPTNAGLQRCGKSCRLRWTNYLRPDIKRGRFSFEEEEAIIQLHSLLGNKWSAIAGRLPGRTDNEIKNYWNTHIRKRLLRMGIDPVTHRQLDLSSILSSSFCNSPYQMNVSNLLEMPQLVNAELLSWATPKTENSNLLAQNAEQNELNFHSQVDHYLQLAVEEIAAATVSFQADYNTPMNSTFGRDYVPRYGFPDQPIPDPSPETSTFYSNTAMTNQNLSFASVLSTPSSSPTPLNSNSSYFTGNSSSQFQMQDVLNVHELIMSSGNKTRLRDTLF